MDCCTQEEEEGGDEFFESLDRALDEEEDLGSSSSSSASAEFRSPLSISRYEIWKQMPRSIADRRGSLLAEMGVPTPPSSSSSSSSSSSPSPSSSSSSSSSSSCFSCSNASSSSSDCHLGSSVHSVGVNLLVHSNSACKPDSNNHSRASSLDNNRIEDYTSSSSKKNGTASIQRSTSSNSCSSSFSSFTQCREDDQIQTQQRSTVQAGGGGASKMKGEMGGKSSDSQRRTMNRGEEGESKKLIKEGMAKKTTTMEGEIGRDSGCVEELLESSSGLSPIMQEVWRRERVSGDQNGAQTENNNSNSAPQKKRRGWFKTLRELGRGSKERSSHGSGSEDKESSIGKGRKSGSATDDSQEAPPQKAKRVKVHSHRKSMKEFTELHVRQEFQGHEGSVWSMKFSPDGRYLASAGQDRVVRVWEVILEQDKGSSHSLDSLEDFHSTTEDFSSLNCNNAESRNRNYSWKKASVGRKKTMGSANFLRPPKLFRLSEKPKCSFFGHTEDILDLSWSKSQTLLSSSMDKTVRLWDISCGECLMIFTHNDYVTCIQFNPTDDGFFISGSLDGKVRIWSIQDHQVVNWIDLHEMVTAACYTPDGKGAVVGSYKGTCRIYKQEGNKLQLEYLFDVQNKGKRSHGKKITGLQFVPGEENKVLITSSDSRIRIYDKTQLSSKFKGFRNAKSLICASFSANGRYIVCASEDSRVCVWSHNDNKSNPNETKYSGRWKDGPSAYESFHLKNVLVALPWPGISHHQATTLADQNHSFSSHMHNGDYSSPGRLSFSCLTSSSQTDLSHTIEMNGTTTFRNAPRNTNLSVLERSGKSGHKVFKANHHQSENTFSKGATTATTTTTTTLRSMAQIGAHGVSATWPEEKLFQVSSIGDNLDIMDQTTSAFAEDIEVDANLVSSTSAWGLVIVTSGSNGEVMVFQNYGLPVRI